MKYSILSGLFWGIDTALLALLVALSVSGLMPASTLYVGVVGACIHDILCAIILWFYMLYRSKLHETIAVFKRKKVIIPIVLSSLLGGPIGMTGYAIAANNIGAGYAAAISALYPAFGVILSSILLRERLSSLKYCAFAVTLIAVGVLGYCSCAQTSNGADFSESASYGIASYGSIALGLFAAILSVIGWGSEAVACAWATRKQSVDDEVMLNIRETVSALAYAVAIVPLCTILPVFRVTIIKSYGLIALALAISLLGTASYLCYYRGIAKVGATRAMAGNITYAVWSMIAAAILSKTMPPIIAWGCCVVIIAGTVIVAHNESK